jgi:hypothetical protein
MSVIQLELNLREQLAQAKQSPQETDWQQLCLAFDAMIGQTPVDQRLAAAADAIEKMAELFAARAGEIFGAWQRQRVAHEGPVVDGDLFAEFVRQSFHLDLDDLVGEPELYVRFGTQRTHSDAESIVEYRTKDEVLAEVGSAAEIVPVIEELEYDEDIGAWIGVIQGWLRQQEGDQVGFGELLRGTSLPVVKVWLALLLGGFKLRQSGAFYEMPGVSTDVEIQQSAMLLRTVAAMSKPVAQMLRVEEIHCCGN